MSGIPSVSILISTRPYQPLITVDAIRQAQRLASTLQNVEFCIKIDHDDPATLEEIQKLISEGLPVKYLIADGRGGRLAIGTYTNLLAWNSSGKLLWYWSDEFRIRTTNWDLLLDKRAELYHDKILVLYPQHTRGGPFGHAPLITRRWLEATGRFTYHPAIDSYLDFAAGPLRQKGLIVPYIMKDVIGDEITPEERGKYPYDIRDICPLKRVEEKVLHGIYREIYGAPEWDLNQPRTQQSFKDVSDALEKILLAEGPVLQTDA